MKLLLILLVCLVISSQANAATRYLFFVSKGTLQQITSKNNNAWSSPVIVPTTNLYSSSSVAAITLEDQSLRVYYQSTDGSIIEASRSPSSNTWFSTTLPINSTIYLGTPLSATYSGGIFVFFLDGSFLVRMVYTTNIWALAPTSVFGFQSHVESQLASVNLTTTGDLRIYYKRPSSDIISEIGGQGSKWQSNDVPSLGGNIFTSILYVSPPQPELHVYAANVNDQPATIKDATYINVWNRFGTPSLFDRFVLKQASRLTSGPYDGYYSYLYVIDANSTLRELYLGRGYVAVGVLAQSYVGSVATTTV